MLRKAIDFLSNILTIELDPPPDTDSYTKRLKKCGITEDDIPREFIDPLSLCIMSDPISLNPPEKIIVSGDPNVPRSLIHNFIIDRTSLRMLLKDSQDRLLHPGLTDTPIKEIVPLPQLKNEISNYVTELEEKYRDYLQIIEPVNALAEKITHLKSKQRSELAGFKDYLAQQPIPARFKQRTNNKALIKYPVLLDDTYVIDYDELTYWWNVHFSESGSSLKYHHPDTYTIITKITFDEELYHEISQFLAAQERNFVREKLAEQLESIENYVKRYHHTRSAQQRLDSLKHPKEQIPQEFIGTNFVDRVMQHPIVLDGQYHVDYLELKDWWNEEGNLHINKFTGTYVNTIEYDVALKIKIEDYIKKAQTAIVLPSQNQFFALLGIRSIFSSSHHNNMKMKGRTEIRRDTEEGRLESPLTHVTYR